MFSSQIFSPHWCFPNFEILVIAGHFISQHAFSHGVQVLFVRWSSGLPPHRPSYCGCHLYGGGIFLNGSFYISTRCSGLPHMQREYSEFCFCGSSSPKPSVPLSTHSGYLQQIAHQRLPSATLLVVLLNFCTAFFCGILSSFNAAFFNFTCSSTSTALFSIRSPSFFNLQCLFRIAFNVHAPYTVSGVFYLASVSRGSHYAFKHRFTSSSFSYRGSSVFSRSSTASAPYPGYFNSTGFSCPYRRHPHTPFSPGAGVGFILNQNSSVTGFSLLLHYPSLKTMVAVTSSPECFLFSFSGPRRLYYCQGSSTNCYLFIISSTYNSAVSRIHNNLSGCFFN